MIVVSFASHGIRRKTRVEAPDESAMKSLFYWFWSLATFPPLWFVVAFALFWVGCELYIWNNGSLPPAGVVHQLKSEEKPGSSIQLKVPQGWELKSLPPIGTRERFTFLPTKGNYPYLFVEIVHPEPEASKKAHKEAKNHDPKPLFTAAENRVEYYDADRNSSWKVKQGQVTDTAEATVFSDAVYQFRYFHHPSQRYTLPTLEKIVASIRPLEEADHKMSASVPNHGTESTDSRYRFEMSTESDRLERMMAPYYRLQVLGVAASILLVLFVLYAIARRKEIRQRIENTTRMMSVIKRGRSLQREFAPDAKPNDRNSNKS